MVARLQLTKRQTLGMTVVRRLSLAPRVSHPATPPVVATAAHASEPAAQRPHTAKPKKTHPDREAQFLRLWQIYAPNGLVAPTAQHRFHSKRRWRFDFAWPSQLLAVEIDGGIFQAKATGHRSITGVMRDGEKSNAAQAAGWCVLRFHSRDLDERPAEMIEQVVSALATRSA